MKTFSIGLILYKPEYSLIQRIKLILEQGLKLYILDNSPYESRHILKDFLVSDNLKYITAGDNIGLGYGLSIICSTAFYEKSQFLFFLDQDTYINLDTIQYVKNYLNNIYSPTYENYSIISFSGKSDKKYNIVDQDLVINSGSLFDLSNLFKIGWHNKNYFVDCVDYEICLKSKNLGFKVGCFYNVPGFDHEIEQPDIRLSFFSKILLVRRYNAFRVYDSIKGYIRLIFYSLRCRKISNLFMVVRSLIIYLLGQFLIRFLGGFKSMTKFIHKYFK